MTTISTFGVTPDTLKSRVHNLKIDERSDPTYADVEALITGIAGQVCNAASSKNIAFEGLTAADPTYQSLREGVINGALATLLVGRNRIDPTTVAFHERQWSLFWEQMRSRPEEVQSRERGPQLVDYIGTRTDDLEASGFNSSMAYKVAKGGL